MEYMNNIVTRLAEKCAAASPSGYGGPYVVDSEEITVDSTLISVDSE